jgi:hypothetical protein
MCLFEGPTLDFFDPFSAMCWVQLLFLMFIAVKSRTWPRYVLSGSLADMISTTLLPLEVVKNRPGSDKISKGFFGDVVSARSIIFEAFCVASVHGEALKPRIIFLRLVFACSIWYAGRLSWRQSALQDLSTYCQMKLPLQYSLNSIISHKETRYCHRFHRKVTLC